MMFGRYDYRFQFEYDGVWANVEEENGLLVYRRVSGTDTCRRILASDGGTLIVNPVEPLNLPKEITNYLEIEFDPIFIEPNSVRKIYLTFPVEIGIFVETRKDIEVLDLFSLSRQKYTLYGPPSGGVIARWHRSEVFSGIPDVDPLREGILELSIRNTYREWAEVSRAVFESYDMKIYYGDLVSMVAQMRIINKYTAETDFFDEPLLPGMKKSIELYVAREIPIIKKGFLMEWGLT